MIAFGTARGHRLTARTLGVTLLAAPLCATTFIVDSSGGGQFTDIQSAINAAQPGDVVLVHVGSSGGNYAGFTLDKGLVIIAYGMHANSAVQITNIPTGQRAALGGLRYHAGLDVSNCAGPVFVDGGLYYQSTVTTVSASNDVRFSRFVPNGDATHPALTVQGARVELVDSELLGGNGDLDASQDGTAGLRASAGARVQLARSIAAGGQGSDASGNPYHLCGNGGPALSLAPPVEIFAVGPQVILPVIGHTGWISGGIGGWALYEHNICWSDGSGSCAITGGGPVEESGVIIRGGYTDQTQHCNGGWYEPAFCGPTDIPVNPPDPSLQLTGTPSAGAMITFTVYGEPGASAVLNLGRNMILVSTPGVEIERLAPANRVIPLGTIPASGSIARNLTLPASFTPGLLFVAQAEVTGTNGLRRTNSTPIVVR